jgi:general secretion pathway protein F
MPTFTCQSIGPDGVLVEGRIVAGTRASAFEQLRSRGHLPVTVAESSPAATPKSTFLSFERGKIGDKQLLAITKELSLLLSAGQQLEQALSLIARSSPSARLRRVLGEIRERLRSGSSFADTLEVSGRFPPLYVAMVRAGEASGMLDQTLERTGQLLGRSVQMRETIISALLYPAILVSVAVLSVGLMLKFVVPQFAALFEGTEVSLPWITQFVLWASGGVQEFGVVALLVVLLAILMLPRVKTWTGLDLWWDRFVLRLPIIGDLIAVQQTARFARTLASLHRSGVALPVALGLAGKVVGNRAFSALAEVMRTGIREGRTLGSALVLGGPVPPLASHLIRVGEESGKLDEVLVQIADIYDAKFELAVKRLLAILEPACVISLGIVIGGIIVAILLAVISVNELAI